MARLEDLQPNAAVCGILPDWLVTVLRMQWFGSAALELTTTNAPVWLPTTCSADARNGALKS
jgi:hypothetical protein